MSDPGDYHDDYNEHDQEEDEEDIDDCGMMPSGQCMQAATEYCDWICSRGYVGSMKRKRKKS